MRGRSGLISHDDWGARVLWMERAAKGSRGMGSLPWTPPQTEVHLRSRRTRFSGPRWVRFYSCGMWSYLASHFACGLQCPSHWVIKYTALFLRDISGQTKGNYWLFFFALLIFQALLGSRRDPRHWKRENYGSETQGKQATQGFFVLAFLCSQEQNKRGMIWNQFW